MKKFLLALVFAICILSVNFCSADPYENDPNYVFVAAGQMGYYYFYLPSVNVQEYNPPHYQITGHFIHYGGFDGKTTTHLYPIIKYNWYTKKTFHLEDGYWRKSTVDNESMAARHNRAFADALFRAAYGMDFYGY